MTWEELINSDPKELLLLSDDFAQEFPPVHLDANITIGMSAHGNVETTIFALRALFASVVGNFELILVDDASRDDTGILFELVMLLHENTKVFRFIRNIEYSGSLNTILSHASGSKIFFISNDIFVTPSYISTLLATIDRIPDVGIVRGCSNFVDNGLIPHNIKDCGELDNLGALFTYAAKRAQEFSDTCQDDPFLTGDAFVVSREVLNAIGYIDTQFYGYFADHDFAVRAKQAAFRPHLAMGAFAWHQHGSNIEYLLPKDKEEKLRVRWARVNENWARFKGKYDLPICMPYEGMRCIPWNRLASLPASKYLRFPPCNHTDFCIPSPDAPEWFNYRASRLAEQAKKMMYAARLKEAEQLCHQALVISPTCVEAISVLGSVLTYQGKTKEGLRAFQRAIKVDPSCVKAHSNLLLCMNYSEQIAQSKILMESKRWELSHCLGTKVHVAVPQKRSKIRVGYISPDFRRHSVGYFLLPLLECHDRSRFEIFCFSDVSAPDDTTRQIVSCTDGWRDISQMDNDEAESCIREVAPDILVDLAGHTGQIIRLPIFAQKAAPVQVSWLGYPNTTGVAGIDYRITDEIADPIGNSELHCNEKLYRISGCFLCYQPPSEAPEVSQLPAIKNGYITFGSFNLLPKIQDCVVDVWCKILTMVPESRLILKNHFFRDQATVRRLKQRFVRRSVDQDRIIFAPSDPDTTTHLAQYAKIDIALDTFPYNGTTTTCEALWMGVPVVTLLGKRHAGRVGASLLKTVGLNNCISQTLEGYVSRAVQLSSSIYDLNKIRSELREQMNSSQLCDALGFTKKMETLYCDALGKLVE